MNNDLKKVGAKVYLSDDEMLIEKITYVHPDETENEPLSRFIHLGMFTDSILFGDESDIRFIVHPYSLQLYDTDVDTLEFINKLSRSVTISCFGQQAILTPGKAEKFLNSCMKKFKHSLKSTAENK